MKKISLDFLKKISKEKLFIGLLVGVLLLIISMPTKSVEKVGEIKEDVIQSKDDTDGDYVKSLESRLEKILGKMKGVGKVKVMITLEDNGESVVEKDNPIVSNESKDSSGNDIRESKEVKNDETTIYVNNSDGSKMPYVIKITEPKIKGILVVAEGGDNSVTAQNILDGILALFDVETHKIKVVKMVDTEVNK